MVREAAKRTLHQRHYDVQIMGGAALHLGNIAEMKTGEGKTLVGTLPTYLNALSGKGVHVVTVNDYLAKYQAEWMGRVYHFLGLDYGVILPEMTPAERRIAYAKDITYGTNNEFGFDYLRDNMAGSIEDCVQREHNYAIVDEVDSILVDEARTPLIISGPAEDSPALVRRDGPDRGPPRPGRWPTRSELKRKNPRITDLEIDETKRRVADYEVDEKKRTVAILERGIEKVEDRLGIDNLYESANTPLISYLNNALKAKDLFRRDKDYVVVDDGEVLIVDEHTGRTLHGRRYNEGLHQAIEAKERRRDQGGVPDPRDDHAAELLPPLRQAGRHDRYGDDRGERVLQDLRARRRPDPDQQADDPGRGAGPDLPHRGRQVRRGGQGHRRRARDRAADPGRHHVGGEVRAAVPASCARSNITHEVLNAKQHAREAAIVAEAGRKGAVTVATNMAGRGTDIILGGNPEYLADKDLRARGIDPAEATEEYEAEYPKVLEQFEKQVKEEQDEVREARRPVRARHRAARVPPDRQPAARSRRPSGRPGRVPVLPVAGGRPDAPVQARDGRLGDVAQQRRQPCRWRTRSSRRRSRRRRARSRRRTSRPGRTSSSTTT